MRRLSLVGALIVLVLPAELAAQSAAGAYDSTYFTGLEWRNIGPNRGGRSIASAGSPSRPNEYYFGATGGGLWKTTDAGITWKPVTDGKIKSSSVSAVAIAESNPDIVYIGMGETEFRGNIMQGDGVYRSGDAGKTWTNIGLAGTQAIARVRIDRTNPDLDRELAQLESAIRMDLPKVNALLASAGQQPVSDSPAPSPVRR